MKKKGLLEVLVICSLIVTPLINGSVAIAETLNSDQPSESSTMEEVLNTSTWDTLTVENEEDAEVTEDSWFDDEASSVDLFKSPSSNIQNLLDLLTTADLENAVGADGTGDHEAVTESYTTPKATYPNVNNYIATKGFTHPKIERDPRYGTTASRPYKLGYPIGVVIHETANPRSSIKNEVDFMYSNKNNAFVHAYASGDRLIETAPAETLAWGAGPKANPFFLHIELVQSSSFDEFARSVNNDAYWVALQLKSWGLLPTSGELDGTGTIISHNSISKFFGGTNHVDPIGYFATWGYDMSQFIALVQQKYATIDVKPIEKELYKDISLDLSIVTDKSFNTHTLPYPYEGYQITGNTLPYQGKQVHISREAKTSVATYYLADGIGWINKAAFQPLETKLMTSPLNREGRVISTLAYFYTKPFNTLGTERTGETTGKLHGTDVTIIEQAKINGELTYLNIEGFGWIDKKAILIYEEEKYSPLDLQLSVILNQSFNIHTAPYPYKGFQITGNTLSIQGKQVRITNEAKTSVATYYLVEDIGWINKNAFQTLDTSLVKTPLTAEAKILTKNNYFYTEPFNTLGTERTGETTASIYQTDVNIIEQATSNGQLKYFHVAGYGWVDKSAVSLYEEENYKTIDLNMSVLVNKKFNIHTAPYPYKGFKIIGDTLSIQGKQVTITKEAKTSVATYYLVEGIGWINSNAFQKLNTTIVKKVISRDAKIITKGNFLYTEPFNTLGSQRTGETTALLFGKNVKIIGQAGNNGKVQFYQIQDYGWVDKSALSLYEEPNYQVANLNLSIKVGGTYNVHTLPYPYFGFKITGTTSPYQGKQVHVSQQAKTSHATYYLVDGIGWINKSAFNTLDTSIKQITVDRDAKGIKGGNFFYTQPFNTMGAERTGKKTAAILGQDVKIIGQASRGNQILYYHVKNYGWVDKTALLLYDIPAYKSVNLAGSITSSGVYNIHSLPYPYKGFKITGTTQTIKGKSVKITREALTSAGTYYEVSGYGWINKKAISFEADKFKKVQSLLNSKYNSGNYGVQVTSMIDGSTASLNANTRFTAASTGKLPAIYYTQKQINTGKIKANSQFTYTNAINNMPLSYQPGGAGILQGYRFGTKFSLDTILNWTIKYSDNQGTNFIAYYACNQYNQAMRNDISNIIGRKWDSPFSITAKENALLMEAIYRQGGQATTYLQNTVYDDQRIPKYLPVKVGHKIGDVYDLRHDVAIVYADKPYVLSVMTKGNTSYETISKMSLDIYNLLK